MSEPLWWYIVRTVRWAWPGWWLYVWYVNRFIRHDCDENPVVCRCDFMLRAHWWLDV